MADDPSKAPSITENYVQRAPCVVCKKVITLVSDPYHVVRDNVTGLFSRMCCQCYNDGIETNE